LQTDGTKQRSVFVDGHVHLYPEVELAAVFAALRRHAGDDCGSDAAVPMQAVLVLADPRGIDGFGRLTQSDTHGGLAAWRVEDAGERHVEFRDAAGSGVLFLRGRQLVTEEGLEVLAAGIDGSVRDGLSLAGTLENVRARGGWSTIAWGVGKWLGRRGRLVSEAVRAEADAGDVALGDNGGRPWFWASVPQFDFAAECGMRVLPGSDPLRVPGDEARIGSYGFEVDVPASAGGALARAVSAAIMDRRVPLRPRGTRVGVRRFVLNQLRLRTAARSAR
jgi:hypothetical protein